MNYFEVISLLTLIVGVVAFVCGVLGRRLVQNLGNAFVAGYGIAVAFEVLIHNVVRIH